MSTRTYLTCKPAGTRLAGPLVGDWTAGDSTRDVRGDTHFTFLLDTDATDGGTILNISSGTSYTKAADQPIVVGNLSGSIRWATEPLSGAGSLSSSGTITICLKTQNPFEAALATVYGHIYAYVTTGDSLDERTVILDNLTDATAWTITATYREMVFTIPSEVAYSSGDRIVVEFGAVCTPPSAPDGDNGYTVKYGTTNTSGVVQADATDGSTTDGAAWVEFSDTLTFAAAPSPPANDACADAIVITDLPYRDGPYDTTQSAGTARGVFYSWTAPFTGRVFASTWGGNYWTRIRIYTGTCAGLVLVKQSDNYIWTGTSQTAIFLDATEGETYTFEVRTTSVNTVPNGTLQAANSGGALCFQLWRYQAPQSDDLFVDCQHIVVYRDGDPINVQSGFYGDTPTNNAIDYTRRPLEDLNGGTNTAHRLYVDLFGDTPIVEILDLATLNVGESEIDYIDDPLNFPNHGENLSSIVFDASGNILTGFFGDAYSVVGQLSSAPACAIRRLDATHADNQTGAPFAEATAYTVAQDVGGSDYIDLSTDALTIFYTSAGREVKRYKIGTGQLADFATLPVQSGVPRPGARGLRLLYPYDGTGGLLVTYGNLVYRLDASGAIVQTYTPTPSDLALDLDKVELTADASKFWVSDQYSTRLFQFDLYSGAQLQTITTQLPAGQLCGFTVYGYRGTPRLYPDFTTEEEPVIRERIFPHVNKERVRVTIHSLQLDCETGVGLTSGQGSDPQIELRISRDGGHTFGPIKIGSYHKLGKYTGRVMWRQLGQARDWVFWLRQSDPVNTAWLACYVEAEEDDN